MGPLSGAQDREVNVGSGSVHDRAIPGRDPQLPFGFLQSCPTAKPALYALRIHEAAARGLREPAISCLWRTAPIAGVRKICPCERASPAAAITT